MLHHESRFRDNHGHGQDQHAYLCLLGCWFRNPHYLRFHEALEDLKTRHLPHHPDEPVVLHRDDMINARKLLTQDRN
jgi:hypothetical protein